MPGNIGFSSSTRAGAQKRVPGVAPVQTSMPITPEEAAAVARFMDGDFASGFDATQVAPGFAPALSAEPDIIYRGVQSPVPGMPGIGPVTPEEAAAVARFMDDGEGFDAPASPAMTVVPKGAAPRAATAQEASQDLPPMAVQDLPPMAVQAAVGSGRLPNPAAPGQAAEETDEELGTLDYLEDGARSLGTGLANAGIGLAGLAGDAQNGARWLARKTGVDSSVLDYVPGGHLLKRDWWDSGEIRDAVEDKFGPLYQPKTMFGEFTRTIGEFAPAAILPGGAIGKIATNVVVPALLSEGAGQIAREQAPQYEGLARLAGGVGGALSPRLMTKGLVSLPINRQRQAAAKVFREENIPVSAGQALGSKRIRSLENLSSVRAQKAAEQQKQAFTRAALKKSGTEANEATPDVLNAAARSIDQRVNLARQSGSQAAYHEALKEAKRQRKNIYTVKQAVRGGGEDAALGYVAPRRLAEADRGLYGTGDFDDLARAGEGIMTPPPPARFSTGAGGIKGRIADVVGGETVGRAAMWPPMQTYLGKHMIPQSRWRRTIPRAGVNAAIAGRSSANSGEEQ